MRLSYRGTKYETEAISHLEVRETELTSGKYRGNQWHYKVPQHIPQLQPKIYLQYRGVAYSTCPQVKAPATTKCACVPLSCKCPKLVVQTTEQVHLENLRRNLERRLAVAKANGNNDLVQMLEKEFQQLAV